MEFHSVVKNNEILSFMENFIELEIIYVYEYMHICEHIWFQSRRTMRWEEEDGWEEEEIINGEQERQTISCLSLYT